MELHLNQQKLWYWNHGISIQSQQHVCGKKLDDGWPESGEEQVLHLLVWRHHIRNNIYIKDVLYAVREEEY